MTIEVHNKNNRFTLTIPRNTRKSELIRFKNVISQRLMSLDISSNERELLQNITNKLNRLQFTTGPTASSFTLREEFLVLRPREYEYIKNLVPNLTPINYTKEEKKTEFDSSYTPSFASNQSQNQNSAVSSSMSEPKKENTKPGFKR